MSRNLGLSREEIMRLLDLDNNECSDDSDNDPVNKSNESEEEDEERVTEQRAVSSTSELCGNTTVVATQKPDIQMQTFLTWDIFSCAFIFE